MRWWLAPRRDSRSCGNRYRRCASRRTDHKPASSNAAPRSPITHHAERWNGVSGGARESLQLLSVAPMGARAHRPEKFREKFAAHVPTVDAAIAGGSAPGRGSDAAEAHIVPAVGAGTQELRLLALLSLRWKATDAARVPVRRLPGFLKKTRQALDVRAIHVGDRPKRQP